MKTRRVYTCTPVAFRGDHTFFARESGLLSRGLKTIGIESCAVMPTPAQDGDEDGLIRAPMEHLQDPTWWKEQCLDAVVFFSWAMPKYTAISKAIKASGAKLFLYLDASGLWNPWSDGAAWFRANWNFNRRTHGFTWGTTRFFLSTIRQLIPTTLAIPRLKHMNLADVVGTGSPEAQARTINYAGTFGFSQLVNRIVLSPPPIPVHFNYGGEAKKKRVICVARWLKHDWAQKNPAMLLPTLALFLGKRPDYEAIVVGRGAGQLRHTKFYPPALNSLRINFVDAIPNTELTVLYRESQMSFCSSYHESFHLASFEAACCGCSVVALDSPDLPAVRWLAGNSGTLASAESPLRFAEALVEEAEVWDANAREPRSISIRWCNELHANQTASRVLGQLGLQP